MTASSPWRGQPPAWVCAVIPQPTPGHSPGRGQRASATPAATAKSLLTMHPPAGRSGFHLARPELCEALQAPALPRSIGPRLRLYFRPLDHRGRHGATQTNHRIVAHSLQQSVKRMDLSPVGLLRRGGLVGAVPRWRPGVDMARRGPASSAFQTSSVPSWMTNLSQQPRSCSSSGINSPAGPGTGGTPRVRRATSRRAGSRRLPSNPVSLPGASG